eukprot:scaffold50100_cov36-Cyclotella_meneghiniana.AAC.4
MGDGEGDPLVHGSWVVSSDGDASNFEEQGCAMTFEICRQTHVRRCALLRVESYHTLPPRYIIHHEILAGVHGITS